MGVQDAIESAGESSDLECQSGEIETEEEEIEDAISSSAFFTSPSTKIERQDSGFIEDSGRAYLAPIFKRSREGGETSARVKTMPRRYLYLYLIW
jgi:hypothetical protein